MFRAYSCSILEDCSWWGTTNHAVLGMNTCLACTCNICPLYSLLGSKNVLRAYLASWSNHEPGYCLISWESERCLSSLLNWATWKASKSEHTEFFPCPTRSKALESLLNLRSKSSNQYLDHIPKVSLPCSAFGSEANSLLNLLGNWFVNYSFPFVTFSR